MTNKIKRAEELRKQIRVMEAELNTLEPDVQTQKINDFHDFCVKRFGRRLKVGDRIARNRMVYHYTTKRGRSYKKTTFTAEVTKPRVYDGYVDKHDDICRIYNGFVYIDILNIKPDKHPESVTKSLLKKCRLVED